MNRNRYSSKKGGASIVLLLIVMVLSITVAGYTHLSSNNKLLTHRVIDAKRAQLVAESVLGAGAEAAYKWVEESNTLNVKLLSNSLNSYSSSISEHISKHAASAGTYLVENLAFTVTPETSGVLITISVGIRNANTSTKVALSESFRIKETSFLDYAIFTSEKFFISTGGRMEIEGMVRGNEEFVIGGCGSGMYFNGNMWSAGDFRIMNKSGRRPWDVYANAAKSGSTDYKSFWDGSSTIDKTLSTWDAVSADRWGKDSEDEYKVRSDAPKLNIPIGKSPNHSIIEPTDPSDSDLLKRAKLAYKAKEPGLKGLYIRVDKNGSVRCSWDGKSAKTEYAEVKKKRGNGTGESHPHAYLAKKGWVEVDDNFKDPHEYYKDGESLTTAVNRDVRVVNLYMDNLLQKFPGTKIIYVEIEDTNGSLIPYQNTDKSGEMAALRIRNGYNLHKASAEGLTVVTHRMMYLEGDYNVQPNTKNALFIADNAVVLSNNWDDGNKGEFYKTNRNFSKNQATETTYKTAFMVGGMDYDQFSDVAKASPWEGLQNIIRKRENWGSSVNLNYEGAFAKLWTSEETHSIAQNKHGSAPNRIYTHNPNFRDAPYAPVGLEEPELLQWKEISWEEAKHNFDNI